MADEAVLEELCNSRYISLKSFKQDGSPVLVPVWSVRDGSQLAFLTDAKSFKAKRMRRNPKVELARCNANGKRILGPFHAGTATIAQDEASLSTTRALLQEKYGWQMTAIRLLGAVRNRSECIVKIQLA